MHLQLLIPVLIFGITATDTRKSFGLSDFVKTADDEELNSIRKHFKAKPADSSHKYRLLDDPNARPLDSIGGGILLPSPLSDGIQHDQNFDREDDLWKTTEDLKDPKSRKLADNRNARQNSFNMTKNQLGEFLLDSQDGRVHFEQMTPEFRSSAINNRRCCKLWPGGIIYYQNVDIPPNQWRLCVAAMKLWESTTCLKFIRKDSHNSGGIVRIKKSNNSRECFSFYGKTSSTGDTMKLGNECFGFGGRTIIHEFGHAIGLLHEQKRMDRDKYIKIQHNNIQKSKLSNFYKDPLSTTLGTPYDYCSIMHYDPFLFNTGYNKLAIKTNDQKYQNVIGYNNGISFYDIKAVNKMYRCASHCPGNLKCRNTECYLNKDCKCVCPRRLAPGRCQVYGFNQAPPAEDPVI